MSTEQTEVTERFFNMFDQGAGQREAELRLAMAKHGYTWTGLADMGITLHGGVGELPYGVGRIAVGRYNGRPPKPNPAEIMWYPSAEEAKMHLMQAVGESKE